MNRSRRFLISAVGVTALLLAGVAGVDATSASTQADPLAASAPPNIVFVLTDDLAWNLVRHMPQVQQLQADGLTFNDYTVTDPKQMAAAIGSGSPAASGGRICPPAGHEVRPQAGRPLAPC